MKIMTSSAVALILSAGLAGCAHAAQTQIDLSSLTNSNMQTYTNGTNYPLAGSTVNITGASGPVSFTLSSEGGDADTTGAILATLPSDSLSSQSTRQAIRSFICW